MIERCFSRLGESAGSRARSVCGQVKRVRMLALLCLAFCSGAVAEPFRLATFNLNWGNDDWDGIVETVKQADADVVCFQETTLEGERILRNRLRADYPYFHAAGHRGRLAAERFAFASRKPLSAVTYIPPRAGPFGHFAATAKLGGSEVRIINVHLAPVRARPTDSPLFVLRAMADAERERVAEIAEIMETVNPGVPTILAGDFNSVSTAVALQRLSALGFVDSVAATHDDPEAQKTWFWHTGTGTVSLRIDYLFHSPHFTAKETRVIPHERSDHALVLAELVVAGG